MRLDVSPLHSYKVLNVVRVKGHSLGHVLVFGEHFLNSSTYLNLLLVCNVAGIAKPLGGLEYKFKFQNYEQVPKC